jgi:hypothetical protein
MDYEVYDRVAPLVEEWPVWKRSDKPPTSAMVKGWPYKLAQKPINENAMSEDMYQYIRPQVNDFDVFERSEHAPTGSMVKGWEGLAQVGNKKYDWATNRDEMDFGVWQTVKGLIGEKDEKIFNARAANAPKSNAEIEAELAAKWEASLAKEAADKAAMEAKLTAIEAKAAADKEELKNELAAMKAKV